MDSLSPMVLAGMIISNFRDKGIKSKEALTTHTIYAEIIAASGLILVYSGLTYLGSKIYAVVPQGLERTELLNAIVYHFLGSSGNVALGLVVALACLTTSIGLITATGDYFSKITQGRLKYKYVVIAGVLVSGVLSILGVEGIIKFSLPILIAIYPVVIVLTLLNLMDKWIRDDLIYKTSVYFTMLVSLALGLEGAGFTNNILVKLFSKLPLWESGFSWLIVSLLGFLIGFFFSNFRKEKL